MDELWTDAIEPATLTGYARAGLEEYERAKGSLVRYLPNEFVPDIVARFEVGRTGLLPVAPFRSFDAETPLGKTQGRQRVTIELPPIGQKMRISEYDQLRQRDGDTRNTVILNPLLRLTLNNVHAISNRLEVARGQALETGALDIAENGFIQAFDFERDPSMEVSATDGGGDYWDDPDAGIVDMVQGWVDAYDDLNGEKPGVMLLTDRRQVQALLRNKDIRNSYSSLVGAPSIVNQQAVNQVLAQHGLPPIDFYDRNAMFDKGDGVVKRQRILSPNKVFFLPAPGQSVDEAGMGATYWGQTLEADEPEYGLEPDELPGIVSAVWKSRDPIGLWTHCAAIALVAIGDANKAMVAEVLPEGS